jgi:hypothetical protein
LKEVGKDFVYLVPTTFGSMLRLPTPTNISNVIDVDALMNANGDVVFISRK